MDLTSPALPLGTTFTADIDEARRIHLDTHKQAADVVRTNAMKRNSATNAYMLHTDVMTGKVVVENLGTGGRNHVNDLLMAQEAKQLTKKQETLSRMRNKLRSKGAEVPYRATWSGMTG